MAEWKVRSAVGIVVLWAPVRRLKKAMLSMAVSELTEMDRADRCTWNERVHSIYRDEFFGERVWDALLINRRAWNSTDGFAGL